MDSTRRGWLRGLGGIAAASLLKAAPARIWGIQLESVRGALKRDPDAVLKAIAAMGCREVEGHSRLEVLPILEKIRAYGINVRSCTTETPLVTTDWELYPEFKPTPLVDAIATLKAAGIEYFRMGYISPGARGDGDDFYRRTADRMNAAGELCRKAGIRFAWRNHAFEFQGRPGLRPIDLYRERIDTKLVTMELDVFWASVAGLNPVRLMKEMKGQIALIHVQDKAKGTPAQFTELLGPGAFVEPGTGVLDLPAIVKAAEGIGVKYYFAGQDEVESDPIGNIERSFTYLKKL